MIFPDRTSLTLTWHRAASAIISSRLCASPLRVHLLRSIGASVGRQVRVGRGVEFRNSHIIIGDRVLVSDNCKFYGLASIEVLAETRIPTASHFGHAPDAKSSLVTIHTPMVIGH